jgi:hypothetical protein
VHTCGDLHRLRSTTTAWAPSVIKQKASAAA